MNRQQPLFSLLSFLLTILGIYFSMKCYSQDSIIKNRFIVIESTKFSDWQTPPERATLDAGDKIKLKRFSTSIQVRGRIDSITDSYIVVKEKQIDLNDIKKIGLIKGANATIIGLSSIALFTGIVLYRESTYVSNYDSSGNDLNSDAFFYSQVLLFMGAETGGVFTLYGLAKSALTKYYRINKGYKIIVKSTY